MPLIYVIEDNDPLRANLRSLLELNGYEVKAFEGGIPALRVLGHRMPELVLCDILMPDMSGFEVLRQARALPDGELLPFLFLSALSEAEQIRDGMGLGADDYLAKPCKPAALLAAVKARLARAAAFRQRLAAETTGLEEHMLGALPEALSRPAGELAAQVAVLSAAATSAQASKEVAAIAESSGRLGRTLTRYRTYLALKAGNILRNEPALTHLGDSVAAIATKVAEQRGRTADLVIDVPPLETRICRTSFEIIVSELCKNAFDFTQPGSEVEVSGGFRGLVPYVAIRDSGKGMTPAQVDGIGPFQRAHLASATSHGTGLGLAICRLLAGLHHWRLDFVPIRRTSSPLPKWEDVWNWDAAAEPAADGFIVELTLPATP